MNPLSKGGLQHTMYLGRAVSLHLTEKVREIKKIRKTNTKLNLNFNFT